MYLEIKNIHKFFGTGENRTEVLKGIDCNIEKGSICVLLGPSGSGKSTLLNKLTDAGVLSALKLPRRAVSQSTVIQLKI